MNPVPGYSITTAYGKRGRYWSCNAIPIFGGIHTGVDYAAPTGTPVVAARPGRAHYCNHGSAFGTRQIHIRCADGTRDFYAHMSSRTVADGALVTAGQRIGSVGASGNVTGPHLHFERHATHTGGWSCSVVRDPAASIEWQLTVERPLIPEPEEDMPLTKEEIDKIAKAVWNYRLPEFDKETEPEEARARVLLAQTHNRTGRIIRMIRNAINGGEGD